MGRPRGKGGKSAEAATNDDGGGGAGEEAAPVAHSPRKPRKDDDESGKVEDNAKVEEVADGAVKPAVPLPTKGPKSTTAEGNGGIKRPRPRRRRRQLEGSSDSVEDGRKGGDDVRAKHNGFRRNGSRRKNSTPRRAAEAGVECDQSA